MSAASRREATPHPVVRINLTDDSEEYNPMPGVPVLEVIREPMGLVRRTERVSVAPMDELQDYQEEVERQSIRRRTP